MAPDRFVARLRSAFLGSASSAVLVLLAAAPVHAQQVPQPAQAAPDQRASDQADPSNPATAGTAVEGTSQPQPTQPDESVISPQEQADIVVTGSRIMRTGAEQPTPVTVLSADEITGTSATLLEGLRDVPQLASSTSEQNTGNLGPVNFLNLRGLGPNRTLVLLDGRRLTPATTGTAPNINALPHSLVQRVDIVTGGASAAYGSDAVAGVVNFILDTKFEGIKGAVQTGISEEGDNQNYTVSLTGGMSFGADRGAIVASAEYYNSEGVLINNREWARRAFQPLRNPNVTRTNPASPSNPTIIITPNAGMSRTPGGVIFSGPLRGIQFGPGGVPIPFDFGQLQSGVFQVGGDFVNTNRYNPLTHRQWRWSAFTHARYELADNLEVFGEINISENQSVSRTFPPQYNLPIFSGNAFLPAQIQQRMTELRLSSITVGKLVTDWKLDPTKELYQGGLSIVDDNATGQDFTGGLSGTFNLLGRRLSWNAYYQHGKTSYERHVPNNPININVFNAIDAVVVTAQNRGSSGLPIGSIVCRTSLTSPNNGCVPLNIFGPNAYTQEALDYIYADASFDQDTRQDAAAINLQGPLFSTGAGDVSAAVGAEWRNVRTVVVGDPLSATRPRDYLAQNAAGVRGLPAIYLTPNPGVFLFGNYQSLQGSYNVKEVYGEALVPLARGSRFAELLEVNGAVRYADYSRSGGVVTWKLGAVYEPVRDVRFRATRSRDIRAPNIIELFSAARQSPRIIDDPRLNQTYQVPTFQQGNIDLGPEKADTTAVGAVFQPRFLPGFLASVDLFDIKIGEAISTPDPQQIVDLCGSGSTQHCGLITRDASNRIIAIRVPNLNVAEFRVRGADLELGYTTQVLGGRLGLRGIATYIKELSQASIVSDAPVVNRAGEHGPSRGLEGVPTWSANFTANYSSGPFTFILQERFISPGKYNNTFNTDRYNAPGGRVTFINDNTIPARFYTDLTLRYKFSGPPADVELFGIVTNLFDQDPPIIPTLGVNFEQTIPRLYDTVGRRFVTGLRFQF